MSPFGDTIERPLDLALGALYAAYDSPRVSAEQLARLAIEAAAELKTSHRRGL